MRKNRKSKYLLLLVLLLGISVGFAALSTQLKINGITNISKNTWNVYWSNVLVNSEGVNPTKNIPQIGEDENEPLNTKVTWSTTLNVPGDFYEFTVDATNAGTIDAMITNINSIVTDNSNQAITLPSYIKYDVTYFDGESIEINHLLSKMKNNKPTVEKYKVRIEFLNTITASELNNIPSGGLSYKFKYEITYGQADSNAVVRPKDYLKVMTQASGDTQPAFDNTEGITKAQVEKIYTLNTLELPSNLQSSIIKSWDVSDKEDGSIMAYALDADSNSKYEIYLGQTGGVKANPDSKKLFNYYKNVTEIDLSNLITDDVETMRTMFQHCTSLKNLDLSNFNTSNVTDMGFMFTYCSSLTSLNIRSFDTSNVTNMKNIFSRCSSLTSLDVSSFDISKVENMCGMFNSCSSLTGIDLSNFGASKVTDTSGMFNSCSSLTSIDLSNFDMSKVTNTSGMFQSCTSLETITLPNNYKHIDLAMFNHVSGYIGESFTIPKTVTNVGSSHMFYDFGKDVTFKKFIVEEGNTSLKTVDDILYSYDGTELLAIPRGKTFTNNTYMMPEGLTFLTELSFSRNQNIDIVVLPNSYEIERYINADNNSYGFSNSGNSLSVAIYRYTTIKTYEVKSDNSRYLSYEGCIYSKDGTELIAVPFKYEGVLNIKNGTTTIGQEAFWDFENIRNSLITTINIPASVTTIEANQLITLNKIISSGTIINIDASNSSYEVVNNQIVAK